jgi:hypothetical protein
VFFSRDSISGRKEEFMRLSTSDFHHSREKMVANLIVRAETGISKTNSEKSFSSVDKKLRKSKKISGVQPSRMWRKTS